MQNRNNAKKLLTQEFFYFGIVLNMLWHNLSFAYARYKKLIFVIYHYIININLYNGFYKKT